MVNRETLRYEDSTLRCEMMCYYDPMNHSYTVRLPLKGLSEGKPAWFSSDELQLMESRVKGHLGTWRLFGIPLRSFDVNVVR